MQHNDTIRQTVRQEYRALITSVSSGQKKRPSPCCCGGNTIISPHDIGYSADDVAGMPDGTGVSFGCGNPTAIAALKPGEVVVDLGSGAGFDCFLAADAVGENGQVIGVDMTPEMINQARDNLAKTGAGNVEFRLGEIEYLPVADNLADVILSNCVISLSPEKPQVFREAFRILKPGGAVGDFRYCRHHSAAGWRARGYVVIHRMPRRRSICGGSGNGVAGHRIYRDPDRSQGRKPGIYPQVSANLEICRPCRISHN